MKTVKRVFCLVLALAALLALSAGAFAVQVVVSNQKLKINGTDCPVAAYNIDGHNYFQLRTIAYLFNATTRHFSLKYDEARKAMVITTKPMEESFYTDWQGDELSPLPAPGTVVLSTQKLYIDGVQVTDFTAYNIDGRNYFQLVDLGRLLDFDVAYDEPTRTMLIDTHDFDEPEPVPTSEWNPDIKFSTLDTKGVVWADDQFGNAALTMVNYWAYWCGPCVGEMPDLQKLANDYAGRGLQVIGIYDGADEAMNKKKLDELGITYPNLRYHEAFDPWMQTGYIPDTIFIDQNGKVLGEVYIGSRSYSDWAEIIESYLE